MALLLSILLGTVVSLALLVWGSFLAARYLFVPRFPDEVCYATTEDGWRIGVARYRPAEGRFDEPVLLVHGIASNRLNFDLTDRLSLAQHLSRAGFDTWVLDLRGRGHSVRPRLFSGLRYEWCFDEYAEKDLPAACREVLRATGARRLHLVGFSTGALACYGYLSSARRDVEVGSLVSMAGPAHFKRLEKFLSAGMIRVLRWMRHRWLMRVLAPGSGYLHPSPLQLIYNPENTDGATQRRAMVNAVASFARNELLQYSEWIRNDVFQSIDHRRDYRAELPRITVPTLFLAGARSLCRAGRREGDARCVHRGRGQGVPHLFTRPGAARELRPLRSVVGARCAGRDLPDGRAVARAQGDSKRGDGAGRKSR